MDYKLEVVVLPVAEVDRADRSAQYLGYVQNACASSGAGA